MASQTFLDQLLEEQADLTAVERFSKVHDELEERGHPAMESQYRALIPSHLPGEGEQFAFEVDLNACTGCKACVVGCHHMNGLAPSETWRKVDTLKEEEGEEAMVQHLTSACHHCLEPGCATGCPVQAYEKDDSTGVVYHLDDQCIGCRYCELKCPYEVPQFNKELGIVRKCDMCIGRLKEGEAPACVQSCPNEAIKITTVSVDAESNTEDLPGNPSSAFTRPTTEYKGKPSGSLTGTERKPALAHGHLPLALMLPLTQLGFGLLVASMVVSKLSPLWGWGLLVAGLGVAPLHLGRPKLAWKAFLGMRTSWLSREMLAFGPFAGIASIFVLWEMAPTLGFGGQFTSSFGWLILPIQGGVVLTGMASVYCSAMIYVDTPRPLWLYGGTRQRFFATVLLGFLMGVSMSTGPFLAMVMMLGGVGLKHYFENGIFRMLSLHPELKQTAELIREKLQPEIRLRWMGYGALLLLMPWTSSSLMWLFALSILVTVEIHERYDFFRAGIAPGEVKRKGLE